MIRNYKVIEPTEQASAKVAVTVNLWAMPGGSVFGTSNSGFISDMHFETDCTRFEGVVNADKLIS